MFKYAIALTGSIATGKSTASKILSSLGFEMIDADTVSHQVLDRQYQVVSELFGKTLIKEGKVDRKALGKIVFKNPAKRKQLEALLHPLIFDEILKQSSKLEKTGKPYFIDIPLFFENRRYPIKKSLVVCTTKELQLKRLMERNDYTEEEALSRISTQISIEEKCKMGDYIIHNSGTLSELVHECKRIKEQIVKEFE